MSWDKSEGFVLCFQGVNKDSYLILETLPTEYDSRVKAMEVDERPTEQYSDIGGLDKQIQEVRGVWQPLAACQPSVFLCLVDQGASPNVPLIPMASQGGKKDARDSLGD